ncbi:carboxypeptidase-like regulatory domain-containing protein [Deinococcus sp. AJ005]|uniref:carboxypeptidase-like regulatory domain-containing protein n=1 Tax=Deinococcus sp. AJ005 TaxID=2652443 RepID=UPI00125CBF71|nr:carboxypeptidase-like regulatory domain-containing protein [Deinococcus sp. AJ005]QFP74999.1 carboxypeptidase regulatory-like domain-containing protein [Deinococcus sp. AJ005]
MFDHVTRQLTGWAAARGLDPVQFSDAPREDGSSVRFTLLGLLPMPPPRTLGRAPLRVKFRYLVTCTDDSVREQMGRLLISAMQEPEFQVELGDVAPELWLALGWPPQPAFSLLVPVTVPLDETVAPFPTRHTIHVTSSPATLRRGRVVDGDGQAVAGARITVDGLGDAIYTDRSGQFEMVVRPEDAVEVMTAHQHVLARPPLPPADWQIPLLPPK